MRTDCLMDPSAPTEISADVPVYDLGAVLFQKVSSMLNMESNSICSTAHVTNGASICEIGPVKIC